MNESSGVDDARGRVISALGDWSAAQPVIATIVLAAALALVAYVGFMLSRWILVLLLNRFVVKPGAKWDAALEKRNFLERLSHFVPLLITHAGLPYLPALPENLISFLQRLIGVWIVIAFARAVAALLDTVGDVYARKPQAAERPIKGYLQVVTLIVYGFSAVVAVAILLDKNPTVILTGVGAASAVLLLIFQNTILSLVAGIQLTNNDLVRIGDWIEMADMGANGSVTEIALNTVTVENFDKSLAIIPAHNFLGKSFRNYRAMQASGARRLMRGVNLDLSTIRFLTEDDVERLSRFAVLRPYFAEKRAEIAAWVEENPAAREDVVNMRRLTNVGTFRAYVTRYLQQHPMIAQELTLQVRQLQSGATGLPLEIYAFVADSRFAVFEGVQSDIFDHLMAILPEFSLRLYQAPSGSDVRSVAPPSKE